MEEKLWKRNNLEGKPGADLAKLREGYELRQTEITRREDGSTIILSSLWKKVDEASLMLVPSVEIKDVSDDNLGDLLK